MLNRVKYNVERDQWKALLAAEHNWYFLMLHNTKKPNQMIMPRSKITRTWWSGNFVRFGKMTAFQGSSNHTGAQRGKRIKKSLWWKGRKCEHEIRHADWSIKKRNHDVKREGKWDKISLTDIQKKRAASGWWWMQSSSIIERQGGMNFEWKENKIWG